MLCSVRSQVIVDGPLGSTEAELTWAGVMLGSVRVGVRGLKVVEVVCVGVGRYGWGCALVSCSCR